MKCLIDESDEDDANDTNDANWMLNVDSTANWLGYDESDVDDHMADQKSSLQEKWSAVIRLTKLYFKKQKHKSNFFDNSLWISLKGVTTILALLKTMRSQI